MTELVKFNLQPPVLDEETAKFLSQFQETVPVAKPVEPPTIWWSHKPAGWCIEISANENFTCDASAGWDYRTAFYDDMSGMYFNTEIVAVVLAYKEYWFKEAGDGTQTRLLQYETGARRRVQYAALIHGLTPKEHRFSIISTSKVSKSKELFSDISKVQSEINKIFKKSTPLWTVWLRIGAQRNHDGSIAYTKLPQGALIAPPRVLTVGYTKKEQWQQYAELSTLAHAWATEQDTVVPGQVVVIQ